MVILIIGQENPSGSRDRAWKQLTITLSFNSGNSQLFPGPPESLEPDRFSCCPRDQSLFV